MQKIQTSKRRVECYNQLVLLKLKRKIVYWKSQNFFGVLQLVVVKIVLRRMELRN